MYVIARVEVADRRAFSCTVEPALAIKRDDRVVVEAEGTQELGRVLTLRHIEASASSERRLPRVLRIAEHKDLRRADENAAMAKTARFTILKRFESWNVPIRVLTVHYSFKRERLVIGFASSQQVDARDVARRLHREFRLRVEMKQMGVRDEAGLIGGIGPCGRSLCCSTWLDHFRSVNVRMAKAQSISLNPSSISGMCGRLKCCLRYEYDQYKEAGHTVPREGAIVELNDGGRGVIIGREVLRRQLTVRQERDHRVIHVSADDVTVISKSRRKRRGDKHEYSSHKRTESGSGREKRAGRLRKSDTNDDDESGR